MEQPFLGDTTFYLCGMPLPKFLQENKGRLLFLFHSLPGRVYYKQNDLQYAADAYYEQHQPRTFFIFLSNPVSSILQFTGIVLLGGISISLVFTL